MNAEGEPFLVPKLDKVFQRLGRCTLFNLLPDKPSAAFIEWWVLCWAAFAIVCYLASFSDAATYLWVTLPIVVISFLRIHEIVTYQINVVLFGPGRDRKSYTLHGYRRSIVLLLFNNVEIVLWFATYYSLLATHGQLAIEGHKFLMIFRESLVLMVANSTGDIRFRDWLALLTATCQSMIGLFMLTVVLARFVSLLPQPLTRDPGEQRGGDRP
jgi:hypothetical protein